MCLPDTCLQSVVAGCLTWRSEQWHPMCMLEEEGSGLNPVLSKGEQDTSSSRVLSKCFLLLLLLPPSPHLFHEKLFVFCRWPWSWAGCWCEYSFQTGNEWGVPSRKACLLSYVADCSRVSSMWVFAAFSVGSCPWLASVYWLSQRYFQDCFS